MGWLQTFYAGGQVGGLLLAAVLSATHPRGGLLVAAGLGLALYPRAGRWCEDATPAKVLQVGLGIRLLACSGLLALGLTTIAGRGWLALLAFAVIVLSWSLLSVSGSGLAARFSSMGEGQGMGVFTAVTAMANPRAEGHGRLAGAVGSRYGVAAGRPWRTSPWQLRLGGRAG